MDFAKVSVKVVCTFLECSAVHSKNVHVNILRMLFYPLHRYLQRGRLKRGKRGVANYDFLTTQKAKINAKYRIIC